MPGTAQDFQHLARDAQFAFRRLVGIGIDADRDRLGTIRAFRQCLLQQLRCVDLGVNPAFEIEAGRQAEIAVGRPREAIDATVLATAIRIERDVEWNVGRCVAGQDRLCAFEYDLGVESARVAGIRFT